MSKKLKGAVTLISNSPGNPTGYGQQAQLLVDRMKRSGINIAVQSNYGREGQDGVYNSPYGPVMEYARGYDLYSNDIAYINHMDWLEKNPGLPELFMTLYDVWVFKHPDFTKFKKILAWVPMDHISVPPQVLDFLKRENVLPIAMAPFGKEVMDALDIKCEYIPHAIDTSVFKPTDKFAGKPTREFFGLKEDDFLIVMNSANKANGSIHRKAFAEAMLAFKIFRQEHPNSYLYIHTEPQGIHGGFNLARMAKSIGLPNDAVLFPHAIDYKHGLTQEQLAAMYTTADVALTISYGEGFGLATVEAQACGTRVIASNWAASKDLAGPDSWLVDGQPLWDEAQVAWFQVPSIPSTVNALKEAYKASQEQGRHSQPSRDFALQFDVEKVWEDKWVPLLQRELQ